MRVFSAPTRQEFTEALRYGEAAAKEAKFKGVRELMDYLSDVIRDRVRADVEIEHIADQYDNKLPILMVELPSWNLRSAMSLDGIRISGIDANPFFDDPDAQLISDNLARIRQAEEARRAKAKREAAEATRAATERVAAKASVQAEQSSAPKASAPATSRPATPPLGAKSKIIPGKLPIPTGKKL